MDKPIDEFMKVYKYVNSSMIDAINNNSGSMKFNTENECGDGVFWILWYDIHCEWKESMISEISIIDDRINIFVKDEFGDTLNVTDCCQKDLTFLYASIIDYIG